MGVRYRNIHGNEIPINRYIATQKQVDASIRARIDDGSIEMIEPDLQNVFQLSPFDSFSDGDDLNNYKDFGNWVCNSTAQCATLKNSPISDAGFTLRVMRGSGYESARVQEVITHSGTRYYRIWSGTAWNTWKKNEAAEEIWVNASPTSDFSAKTITCDVSGAEYIEIDWCYSKGDNTNTQTTRFKARTGNNNSVLFGYYISSSSNNFGLVSRTATITSGGISFTTGYQKRADLKAATETVAHAVPLRIRKVV